VGVPEHELILVRHGDTAWSGTGRFTGHLDVPLNATGREQAAALARCLGDRGPCKVLCSDLRRTRETARVIASAYGAAPQADPRLREEHLGRWQGLTRDEVAARYPAGYARWLAGDVSPFDGREGLAAVADRAMAAVLEALPAGQAPAGRLIVVTHCNTVIGLMGRLLRVPRAGWTEIGSLRPAHWSVLAGRAALWRLLAHDRPPGCQDPPPDGRPLDQPA
jgi:glucosyl-3-phosphoglycerate phosphatase